ncbi:MAG: hypothetical protein DRI86_13895 [Bacteroidetes bacterium]|nr:MAG: hypothetical protein DRI86_13895 [Bacteroidota bacterium]
MKKINILPINWFGNKEKYFKSKVKIVTVGLNPSDKEFRNNETENYSTFRFHGYQSEKDLEKVLNNYFEQKPYKTWFNSFEPILQGMDASYYQKTEKPNIAIHTDICSPWATNPTWSKLTTDEQRKMFKEGHPKWIKLIDELNPDVILISVAKKYLINEFKEIGEIGRITKTKKGIIRKQPYLLKHYSYSNGNKNVIVIFGQAAQKPFGLISNEQKMDLGSTITNVFNISKSKM